MAFKFPGWLSFICIIGVGLVAVILIVVVCARVSVYFEDTCPLPFCQKRKKRKEEKTIADHIFHPGGPNSGISISAHPPAPSDDFITPDIICQGYIYKDAHNTGITANQALKGLPTMYDYVLDGDPCEAVVINPLPALIQNEMAKHLQKQNSQNSS